METMLAQLRSKLQGVDATKVPPPEYKSFPAMLVNVSPETVVTPESALMPFPAIDLKLELKIFHWPKVSMPLVAMFVNCEFVAVKSLNAPAAGR